MIDWIKALLIGLALITIIVVIPIAITLVIPILVFALIVLALWFIIQVLKHEE